MEMKKKVKKFYSFVYFCILLPIKKIFYSFLYFGETEIVSESQSRVFGTVKFRRFWRKQEIL